MAPGFAPLDNRKFSFQCLPDGNLRSVEGGNAGITAVDVAVVAPDKAEAPAELSGHFHQH